MAAPLKYIKDTLGKLPADSTPSAEPSVQDQLVCIGRLRTCACAMGSQKAAEELVPFIEELCREAQEPDMPRRLVDEVLTSLAEALGAGMEKLLGGSAQAHLLFAPLICLCSIDETTVRAQAVDSINSLCAVSSPAQVAEHLGGPVLKLLESEHWFTPRVSGCGLVAATYAKVAAAGSMQVTVTRATHNGDETQLAAPALAGELVAAFGKCCVDTQEPMVRRTAALKLCDAAVAFGPQRIREEMLGAYQRLISEEEQESIRVNALKASAALFMVSTLSDAVGESYLACCADKSWRVRVAVAESLASVAFAVKEQVGAAGWAVQQEIAEATFMQLLEDHESEVRMVTAQQSAAVASVLGAAFTQAKAVPALTEFVLDEAVSTRVELAGTLLELAQPLGAAPARVVYLNNLPGGDEPLLKTLINDGNTNLRLAVITRLNALIDVLGVADGQPVVAMIAELCADKNWRVRWAAMHTLPELTKHYLAADEFAETFLKGDGGSPFLKCCTDNCALIRTEWVEVCHQIALKYGKELLTKHFLPVVEEAGEAKSYHHKAVALHAADCWGEHLTGSGALEQKLLPHCVLPAMTDRVPNLRLMAAQSICGILRGNRLAKPFIDEKIKPVLTKMAAEDADMDAKAFATEALTLC